MRTHSYQLLLISPQNFPSRWFTADEFPEQNIWSSDETRLKTIYIYFGDLLESKAFKEGVLDIRQYLQQQHITPVTCCTVQALNDEARTFDVFKCYREKWENSFQRHKQVIRVIYMTRYHHEISPIDYFSYYMCSEMLCLNIQMRHYLTLT